MPTGGVGHNLIVAAIEKKSQRAIHLHDKSQMGRQLIHLIAMRHVHEPNGKHTEHRMWIRLRIKKCICRRMQNIAYTQRVTTIEEAVSERSSSIGYGNGNGDNQEMVMPSAY